MAYNWGEITSLAYLSLLELDIQSFPIPAKKIKCKDVKICSYQKYAELTNLSVEQVALGNELNDAFLMKGLRPGVKIILYNKAAIDSRLKHSLWHEIGHIKRGHRCHGEKEEIEAHFFAAQANAPNALIRELAKRGYTINASFLMECFGVSVESAEKKMYYLKRFHFEHSNEYDDVVSAQFLDFINTNYPPKTNNFFDDYFDDLENERANWG